MKRSEALTPLSRDHHQALFVALQLQRAESPEPAQVMLAFYDEHGRRHFEIEEGILLPAWLEADPRADHGVAERVLSEHLTIRAAVRRLRAGSVEVEELHELGELLNRHVRFEERGLFPAIEAGLDDEALAALGEEIAAAESG